MSQMDLQNRYVDLLQPIRDLTRNWNVDVASQLEEYLEEIAHVTISFDDGVTKMNFAEAALLIQGSTCVYSRKVEYLHALVYQTLDLVQSKRKQGQAPSTADVDSDLSFAQRMEDDQFLSLDDIHVAKTIDMDEQSVPRSVSTIPRTPISLVPLMDYEKTSSIPLYSNEGELIGSHLDFRMNTSIVHHESGALLLEPLEHFVLQVELNNGRSFTIDQNTPTNQINGLFPPRSSAPVSPDLPDPPDNFPDMDVSIANVGSNQTTPTHPTETADRRRGRVRIAEEQTVSDPWALLDPHDPGTGALNKPFKKGVTFRVPQSLKSKKERKRKQTSSSSPSEPLAEFIRKAFYTCSSQFPKNPLKAPLSSEFEGHYWAEQKRRRLQRKRDNIALKRIAQEIPESEVDEDSLDDYQPLGGGDPPDDDMEAGFEGAFDGFNQSGGQVNNPYMGVEPMAIDDSTSGFHGNKKVVQTYEDLVRNYVESTMMGVATYIQQTDLSQKVHQWEERIKPLLIAEEQRPVFDIHKYGANVIDEFKPTDPVQKKEQLYFQEIGQKRAVSDICRLFAATLQLANDGNVLIETVECPSEGKVQMVDSMKLTLLSTEMAHEAMSQYTAPSLKAC